MRFDIGVGSRVGKVQDVVCLLTFDLANDADLPGVIY
jgi:hypothetical protein